jgi:hypothetical protein
MINSWIRISIETNTDPQQWRLHVTAGIRAAGLSTVAPGALSGADPGALPGALPGSPRWPGAGATGGLSATRPLPAAHVVN